MTTLRDDFLQTCRARGELRSPDRLIAHYELERRLTDRLLAASREDRATVYGEVYQELFTTLTDHPQKTKLDGARDVTVAREARIVQRFLSSSGNFLEIGCGDGALATAVASFAGKSYGLDVTDALIPASTPANFEFLRTHGTDIPLENSTIDVAYSDQLVEHLHPDDAMLQFREVCRVLKPGGLYRCTTPSRYSGPHDISAYFDYVASGLHLKEYDYESLRALFRETGFRSVEFHLTKGTRHLRLPYWVGCACEVGLSALPRTFRALVTRQGYIKRFMGLTAIGYR